MDAKEYVEGIVQRSEFDDRSTAMDYLRKWAWTKTVRSLVGQTRLYAA
jgi:hypothetical protein